MCKTHHKMRIQHTTSLCTAPGGRNCVSRTSNTLTKFSQENIRKSWGRKGGGRKRGKQSKGVVHALHDMRCTNVRNMRKTHQKSERKKRAKRKVSEACACIVHTHTRHVRTFDSPNRMAKTKEKPKVEPECVPSTWTTHAPYCMPAQSVQTEWHKRKKDHGELVLSTNPQFQGKRVELNGPQRKGSELVGKLPDVTRT